MVKWMLRLVVLGTVCAGCSPRGGDQAPPAGAARELGSPELAAGVRSINEVKTWEQLRKVAPIDLGNGATLRLGIEATQCPQWSGILLYSYTEEFDETEIC